jgi:hypothetical protein
MGDSPALMNLGIPLEVRGYRHFTYVLHPVVALNGVRQPEASPIG